MNIVNKILTSIRGGARELGDALVDSQSMRIYEQEVADSKIYLAEARENLIEIIAQKLASERKLAALKSEILENESYAVKALEQSESELALQIADKIASLEEKAAQVEEDIAMYQQNTKALKTQIRQADKIINEHERELTMVKTRGFVQQASSPITQTAKFNQSATSAAEESLTQIKQKQQFEQDKIDASIQLEKELKGEDLAQKLKSSGIIKDKNSPEVILNRLKEKHNITNSEIS